jgi:hypothetical protein
MKRSTSARGPLPAGINGRAVLTAGTDPGATIVRTIVAGLGAAAERAADFFAGRAALRGFAVRFFGFDRAERDFAGRFFGMLWFQWGSSSAENVSRWY